MACILSDLLDYVASGLVSQVNPQLCVRILSIAQDLLFVASNGGKRTPKHVSLPMTIKSLTGLAELITVLNRLGHEMSYTKVEEEKTGMAERQIRSQQNGELIPSSSYHDVFLQFSSDNNDLEECTPSGSGTTHCTNGFVTPKIQDGCKNKASDIGIFKKIAKRDRKRSLDIAPVQILPYSAGKRTSPGRVIMSEGTFNFLIGIQDIPIRKDFAWRICTQPFDISLFQFNVEQQRIPGWTGFNGIVCKQDIPRKSFVGYCQVIDASPMEFSTVYPLLKKSVAMGKDTGVQDIMVVLDLAIYAKAVEVRWQKQEELNRVVIRLGAFHTAFHLSLLLGNDSNVQGLRISLLNQMLLLLGQKRRY